MADVNDEWLDAMIRHQIGLLRLSGRIRNDVLALLDATEADIREQIVSRLARSRSVASQERLIRAIAAIRSESWKKSAQLWRDEMRALIEAEPQFLAVALGTVAPVLLDLNLPPVDTLRALVTSHPFEGRTLRQWSNQIARADIQRIEQQIRIGVVQGEPTDEIARRVVGSVRQRGRDGVTEVTRRQAQAITRTAVNAFANVAKRQFYEANRDVFDEEIYVATLDNRTTPICRSLDGNRYPIGEGPIPPLHFNCRSLRVASINGEAIGSRPAKAVTQRQLLREYAKQAGIRPVSSRAALPYGHKGAFDQFSRGRIRQLTGVVDARLTYQQWLERQPASFVIDVLGPTRAKLFRDGNLRLDRFVNRRGDELSLSQLARRDRAAFIAAGLDPDNFL